MSYDDHVIDSDLQEDLLDTNSRLSAMEIKFNNLIAYLRSLPDFADDELLDSLEE